MMLRVGLIIITMLLPGVAAAETVLTDAFGIYVPTADQAARNSWAGYSETLTDETNAGKNIEPTEPQDILFYLGPKNLIAGGPAGEAMALVLDASGNLVADGAEVTISTGRHAAIVPSQTGVAELFFKPGTIAGQFHAGAAVGAHQSERGEYEVAPDLAGIAPTWPAAPRLQAPFEDFTDLETAPLVDEFGNRILDGAGGMMQLDHGNGQITLLPFVSVEGIGQARILTRDTPGDGQLSLNFERRTSSPVHFDMSDPKPKGPLQINAITDVETASTKLNLGPFLTTEGHVLNDGSTVQLQITTRDGKVLQQSGWTLGGMVTATFLIDTTAFPIGVDITSPLGTVSHTLNTPETTSESEVMP